MPIAEKKTKPKKPTKNFPLFAHGNGQWAKKINGKLHYFGLWSDPDAAIEKYLLQREDLMSGREPRQVGVSLADLCNAFLAWKESRVDSGDLSQRSFDDYLGTSQVLTAEFGRGRAVESLRPVDFERLRAKLSKRLGPVRLGNEITRTKMVFKYGFEAELLERPMRFGLGFAKPTQKTLRKSREGKLRLFEPQQIHSLVDLATPAMKCMILLGVNCGFGNTDCGFIPWRCVDLDNGIVVYPRPKTGVERRAFLWPETVEQLRSWQEIRPGTPAYPDHVFLTRLKRPWHTGHRSDAISDMMRKLTREVGCHRPGLSFYALRHTFQTVAEDAGDLAAVQKVMGHTPHSNDMSAVYREKISDERLQKVADHVRGWLYG